MISWHNVYVWLIKLNMNLNCSFILYLWIVFIINKYFLSTMKHQIYFSNYPNVHHSNLNLNDLEIQYLILFHHQFWYQIFLFFFAFNWFNLHLIFTLFNIDSFWGFNDNNIGKVSLQTEIGPRWEKFVYQFYKHLLIFVFNFINRDTIYKSLNIWLLYQFLP